MLVYIGVAQIFPRDDIAKIHCRVSAVRMATGYGLDDQGVGVLIPVGSRIFFSPRRPNRLWGPPRLLFNGYRGDLPQR
jgi:hypothetical protein